MEKRLEQNLVSTRDREVDLWKTSLLLQSSRTTQYRATINLFVRGERPAYSVTKSKLMTYILNRRVGECLVDETTYIGQP